MAKRIVDEVLNYTIIINGDKGQKELYELEKATRKLREANRDLKDEQTRLKRAGKENTDEFKQLTAEIKTNNAAIKANEVQMSKLQNQLGLTSLTMAQLSKKANELKLVLRNLTPGSADFKKYTAELNQVNNRLRELRLGANQTKFSLAKLGDEFNRYQALAFSVIAAVTGVAISFQKLIDFQGKLSDAQADVAKTTGLSTEAVDDLTASLGLFKTRTARIELLQLAEEAGRLGKDSKQDILEFIQVADQIKVALGDDLQGDVNENIRIIGKLTEQYQVGSDIGASFGEGMTMIGSAINEVASSGASQAGYLVDYTSRLVGISRQANISAQDQIGFAAVLDEAGQRVETSATATSQALIGMFKDTDTYAGIAGMAVTDFRKLLETDANEAFLRFLQGLNGNNAGLEELSRKFDGLGIDGSRAISVLATLASQTDKIREKQTLANESLYQATSLQEEFNKKNTNFAAILDRVNKRLGQMIVDGRLTQWLKEAITWFAVFIGAIEDSGSSAHVWRSIIIATAKSLAVFVVGLLSYKAAMQLVVLWTGRGTQITWLYNVATKASNITTAIYKGTILLLSAAKALLTGNITRATAAMRLFNLVVKANPIGLLLSIVAAAATAYVLYARRLTDAQRAQKVLNETMTEATKRTVSQREEVAKLFKVAKDETLAIEQRAAALKRLNELSPQYLKGLTLETVGYMDATIAINNYIQQLQKRAELDALLEKRAELNKLLLEEQLKPIEDYTNGVEEWAYKEKFLEKISEERRAKNIAGINLEIAALDKYQGKLAKEGVNNNKFLSQPFTELDYPGKPKAAPNFSNTETPEDKAAKAEREKEATAEATRALDRFKALKDKIAELEHQAEIERMQGYEREVAQVQDKYKKLRDEAKGHKAELAKIDALEAEDLRLLSLQNQAETDEQRIKKEEETQKEIQRLREHYGLITDQERLDAEILQLQDAHAQKLISEEEYLIALQNLKTKYNPPTTDVTGNEALSREEAIKNAKEETAAVIGRMSGAVNNLMQLELRRNEVVQQAGESEQMFTKRKEEEEGKRMETTKKYARLNMLLTISQIIADTAAAIMKATAQLGVLALPFQIAYGAMGAVQSGIAIAENNKIQGFEEGLYPVLDHKGRKFNAGVQTNAPTGKLTQPTILAGEKPEIIIDPLTTRHLEMNYPQVIDAIYSSAARVRGYESGHYPDRVTQSGADAQIMSQVAAALAINASAIAKLEQKLDQGISAYYDDAQVRQIRTRLDVNDAVKQARTL